MFGYFTFGSFMFGDGPTDLIPAPTPPVVVLPPVIRRYSEPTPTDYWGSTGFADVPLDWFVMNDGRGTAFVSAYSDFREKFSARVNEWGSLTILLPRRARRTQDFNLPDQNTYDLQ
jgi:hypothetical protein